MSDCFCARLKNFVDAWECTENRLPDADTTVIRRVGSEATVGEVLDASEVGKSIPPRNCICVRPKDKNKLLPKYLFYMLQYTHMRGYWRQVMTGSVQKVIGVHDVWELPIQAVAR